MRFECITVVKTKVMIFCVMLQCRMVGVTSYYSARFWRNFLLLSFVPWKRRQYVFPKWLESHTNLHGVVMYMTSNIVIILVFSNEVSMKFLKLCFSLLNIHPIVLIISPCM